MSGTDRYLLFLWQNYEEYGGWRDLQGIHESIGAAQEAAATDRVMHGMDANCAQIVLLPGDGSDPREIIRGVSVDGPFWERRFPNVTPGDWGWYDPREEDG